MQDDGLDSSDSELGNDRDDDDTPVDPNAKSNLKTKMAEDWNYLKKTIASGGFNDIKNGSQAEDDKENRPSQDMLEFQEKVDSLLEKEEEVIGTHMNLIKENAALLTEEGKLISLVQGKLCF